MHVKPSGRAVRERAPGAGTRRSRDARRQSGTVGLAEDRLRAEIAVKDEFLGLVSHELRTPVTTILGNAQLLAGRKDVGEPVRTLLVDLGAEAERLAGIVENLLVLTQAGSPVDVDRAPEVLERVIRAAAADWARHHPGRDIQVRGSLGGSVVDADRAYVELVLGNLLANAGKYSAPATRIEVLLDRVGDALEIRVLDRGIGFPADDVEQLFATFYRGDAAQKMASGLGIGLSACRRLVELLGGRIWAIPRPNGGSEFGFALPAAAEAPE